MIEAIVIGTQLYWAVTSNVPRVPVPKQIGVYYRQGCSGEFQLVPGYFPYEHRYNIARSEVSSASAINGLAQNFLRGR